MMCLDEAPHMVQIFEIPNVYVCRPIIHNITSIAILPSGSEALLASRPPQELGTLSSWKTTDARKMNEAR